MRGTSENGRLPEDKSTVVSMRKINKDYPGTHALQNVDLDVRLGEVVGLVGKNGAGKSTLVRILMGLVSPDSGTIIIDGKASRRISASEALTAGIAYVPQHVSLMGSLSVAENILVGEMPKDSFNFISWNKAYAEAEERLRQLGIEINVRKSVEGLTVAEQTMLAVAQALFRHARIIILDEPTAALPRVDIDRLFNVIRALKDQSVAIVFISHHLEEVFEICDRVVVLRDGLEIGTFATPELDMTRLTTLIVGEELNEYVRSNRKITNEIAIEIQGLTRRGCYENINFNVRKGEVVGISGLQGSGAGALGAGLFGLERMGIGNVIIEGKRYRAQNPHGAFLQGVAFLPQDRYRFGIVGLRSVRENITYTIINRLAGLLTILNPARERRIVKEFIEKLGIKTPSQNQAVRLLSGGNQQKVVFAKLAATEPKVLILHEPTQGVDVRAKLDIYGVIDGLSAQGIAVIIISSEVHELVGACDRILVMYEGRVIREFRHGESDTTASNILLTIEGGHRNAEKS